MRSCKVSPFWKFVSKLNFFAERGRGCAQYDSLVSWDKTPSHFFSWNFIHFQKSSLLKYEFGEISPEQSNVWNFALWWAPFVKIKKVSAKKVQKTSPIALKSYAKFKRKTDLWLQIWHEEFGEFSPNYSKVRKFYFDGLFLSKVFEVWAKKIQRSYLSWHWTVMQNLKNPDLVVSNMAWRIGWTFIIRASISLKIVHWCALFVQSIYCFS